MDSSDRVRASTPRTRSGCATCRTRRIKCDERKPACERCLRSGWICPGFSQNDTSGQESAFALSSLLSITQYSVPFKIPGTQEERRMLHYYANFAQPNISGYLPTSFWSRTVLQRCQHDVPVRHATAALGGAYMEYITAASSSQFDVSEETAMLYGKAIKAVRNYLGRNGDDKSMVLICTALFYCFELLRSERRGAIQVLEGGTRLLRTWQAECGLSNSTGESREELLATFIRMELQAAYYDDRRLPILTAQDEDALGLDSLPFDSLYEAQDSIFVLFHSGLTFLVRNTGFKFAESHRIPLKVVSARRDLVHRFDRWERRFNLLLQSLRRDECTAASMMARHRTVLAVFKLHWRTAKLLLLHSLQDNVKESTPSFDDVADELLQLAGDVIRSPLSDGRKDLSPEQCQTGERSFSLHLGIVTPTLLLALKTQHAHIRALAVELLQAAKGRREGFHDAQVSANFITELDASRVRVDPKSSEASGSSPPPLECVVDSAMNIPRRQDQAERLARLERLWTAAT